jgi:hypothetical protein
VGISDFEAWFLLAYTGYIDMSLFALMWVGRDRNIEKHERFNRSGGEQ